MVMDPVALPAVDGENVDVSVTLDDAFRVIGAVAPLTWYALPVTEKLEMCTAALPVLLTTICRFALAPTATVPKLTLAGEADNWPTGAADPAPLNGTFKVGLFGSLLLILRFPVTFATVVGANTAMNDAVAPGASVAGTVSPLTLKLPPLTEISEIVTEAVPVLVRVKLSDFVCPSTTLPKL